MKKFLNLIIVTSLSISLAMAQKASDVLENGIKIKSRNEVFIRFDGTNILYDIHDAPNNLHFKTFADSVMLLPVDRSVNFYIRPLNPLNFSLKAENKIMLDPIDEAAATSLSSMISFLSSGNLAKALAKSDTAALSENAGRAFCADMSGQVAQYEAILALLKEDQKEKIRVTFTDLKQLNFDSEPETKEGVNNAANSVREMAEHYTALQNRLVLFKRDIDLINCEDKNEEFIAKQVLAAAAKEAQVTFSVQKKRLSNLENAFKLVKKAQQEASAQGWLAKIAEVPANKGKISVFTIKVFETGYKLSEENEITEADTREKASRTLRLRNFQRFVPEVSVGVAYTTLSFPKYGTNTDAAGKYVVAAAGEDKINKVNFTTMINYNFFLTNSPVHPFWQIGIGVNTDFPTLLTGVGARLNANGTRRLALTVGLATTWIKTLNKLQLNQSVSGPAEVEKDIDFKFNTKPKPYFGVQYNF